MSALLRLAGQLRDHQNCLELIASAEGRVQDALKLVGLSYRSDTQPARA